MTLRIRVLSFFFFFENVSHAIRFSPSLFIPINFYRPDLYLSTVKNTEAKIYKIYEGKKCGNNTREIREEAIKKNREFPFSYGE